MKAILISIKPKYVAKILNGEKTIEIRKTMPKCDLPIDVYIYCTKDKDLMFRNGSQYMVAYGTIKEKRNHKYNGKVVAKFTLNKVEEIKLPYTKFNSTEWVGCEAQRTLQTKTLDEKDLLKLSYLEENEIYMYLNFKHSPDNVGYAWHISNLEIFDKPKELGEFYSYCKDEKCEYRKNHCSICYRTPLTKAPQSFMFIETEELK